ncbi:MAG: Ig-like domain-containing protein [Halanaerobiales bacterium]
MKKKWTGLLIILILVISFAGCTQNPFGNKAPSVSVPEDLDGKTVKAGEELEILIEYSDPDDDEVFIKSVEPSDIEEEWKDKGSSYIWTPSEEDVGEQEITITVTDGELEDETSFTITVEGNGDGGKEPDDVELEDFPEELDQTFNTGDNVNFRVEVVEDNNSAFDFFATGELGENFDPETRIFDWNIGSDQYGEYKVNFYVVGESGSDSQELTFNVNDTPQIKEESDKRVHEGKELEFKIIASDRDNSQDELNYELVEGPEGAEFSDRTFSWKTESGDYGEYPLKFRVQDENGAQDEIVINATINDIPKFEDPPSNQTFKVGEEGTFSITAVDNDNEDLEIELENFYTHNGNKDLKLGDYFDVNENNNTGKFSWAPIKGDEGVYSLKFRVEDRYEAVETKSIVLTVE